MAVKIGLRANVNAPAGHELGAFLVVDADAPRVAHRQLRGEGRCDPNERDRQAGGRDCAALDERRHPGEVGEGGGDTHEERDREQDSGAPLDGERCPRHPTEPPVTGTAKRDEGPHAEGEREPERVEAERGRCHGGLDPESWRHPCAPASA
jgi:hypothetical protein